MVIEGYSRQRSQCKGYQEYEPWVICHKSRIPLKKKMNEEYRRKQIGRSQIYRVFRIGGIITARNSSCGKVMFSQARVKNSVHGGCTPPGRHPPPRDGHCSGRYTSYWNAFLVCSYYNQNDHCFALDTCNFELSILPAKSGEFTCEVMI